MSSVAVELVHDARTSLGEGIIWSPIEQLMLWVDIDTGDVFRHSHTDGPVGVTRFDDTVGSVAPRRDGGWVIGLGPGVALTDTNDEIVRRVELPGVPADQRTNDGAVDPAGRLFQGTMPRRPGDPVGSLFRVDADLSVRPVVEAVKISNGIAWSPDASLMYYIDTLAYRVDVFDYDIETGEIAERRPLISFDGTFGGPDGMTVDRDGCLWVACFGGGGVRRYSPSGDPLEIVVVDAPNTTSCAFGGPDLDTLYITSARQHMTPERAEAHPLSGGLFVADVGATGLPTNLFAA
jgi:sugar lactone lactonase YvrE